MLLKLTTSGHDASLLPRICVSRSTSQVGRCEVVIAGALTQRRQVEVAAVARGASYFFDNLGCGTSSDAEWLALRLALQFAHSLGEPDFDLIGDSLEVIRQASGSSRCRSIAAADHLAKHEECAASGRPRRLLWTPRRQNLAGIALAGRNICR